MFWGSKRGTLRAIDVYVAGVSVDPQSMAIDLYVVADSIEARVPLAEFLKSTVSDTPDKYKYDVQLVFNKRV
jgi:hypothetical protein